MPSGPGRPARAGASLPDRQPGVDPKRGRQDQQPEDLSVRGRAATRCGHRHTSTVHPMDCGPWPVACRLWPVDRGLWPVDCGLWTVDCGLSTVACGPWTVACRLWPVDRGLWPVLIQRFVVREC